MKSLAVTALLCVSVLGFESVWADCTEPAAVGNIPSGATASRDDMISAQRAIKAYDTAMKEFTECLEKSGDASSKEDAALDRLHKIADRFNEELRAFKQKNGA